MDMDDAFGFTGCSGGVEDVERGFCIELFRVTDCTFLLDPFVPIDFLWSRKRWPRHLTPDDNHMANGGAVLERFIHYGF